MITNPAHRAIELLDDLEYYVEKECWEDADSLSEVISDYIMTMDAELLEYYQALQEKIHRGLYTE
jgi:hypothetical protein